MDTRFADTLTAEDQTYKREMDKLGCCWFWRLEREKMRAGKERVLFIPRSAPLDRARNKDSPNRQGMGQSKPRRVQRRVQRGSDGRECANIDSSQLRDGPVSAKEKEDGGGRGRSG